jgi:hypothetical protein
LGLEEKFDEKCLNLLPRVDVLARNPKLHRQAAPVDDGQEFMYTHVGKNRIYSALA